MREIAAPDQFHVEQPSAGRTFRRTLRLFRTLYWKALVLFLAIHFPFRVLTHFVISSDYFSDRLSRSVAGNTVLLVSWTLTEGAILALLVQYRRTAETDLVGALRTSVRYFPTFLASRAIFLIAVVVAGAFLLIPGIIVGCVLMLHGWLIFDQGVGPLAALAGSYRLVHRRIGRTLGISAPVLGATLAWLAAGFVLVATTLRFASQHIPIFKIAPLTLTLMESGMFFFTVLTGILYATYRTGRDFDSASTVS